MMDNLKLTTVFARNCSVRRIDKAAASSFLDANHRMGDTTCRYRYGLFIERSTGAAEARFDPGTLVAAATFSNARRWTRGERKISSYEWIRYASLKGIRVVGGMGKLLQAFIDDVRPDDIMTYVDSATSDGASYEELGFRFECRVDRPAFSVLKFRLTRQGGEGSAD